MKKSMAGSLLVLIILISECSSMNVMVKYDDTIDFGKYKSFYFIKPERVRERGAPTVRDPFFNRDVMREIRSIMEEKGFTIAGTKATSNLLVVFYGAVKNQRYVTPPTYYVGRWGRVRAVSPGHSYNVKKGALVIDIVDREKKELIWQGTGKGVLNPRQPAAEMVKGVRKILDKFPPHEL